jgi:hypothetical protein
LDVDDGTVPSKDVPYFWQTSKENQEDVEEYIGLSRELVIKKSEYKIFFKDMLDTPGGQLHWLDANLQLNNLLRYVTITAGEPVPVLSYGFIWSDAAHTSEEIQVNMGRWLDIMTARSLGSSTIWAFHDRVTGADLHEIDDIFVGADYRIGERIHLASTYVIEVFK